MRRLAVPGLVLGMAVAIALGAWAVFLRDDSGDEAAARDLASLVRTLETGERPATGDYDGGFSSICFEEIPTMVNGGLNPELVAFAPRLLGEDFELERLQFTRACREGVERGTLEELPKSVRTRWRYKPNGELVGVHQTEGQEVAPVVAQYYASFQEAGYGFWIGPEISTRSGGEGTETVANRRAVALAALRDLKPTLPLECFVRQEPRTWEDLAEYGIGDPRGAIPALYKELRFWFLVLEMPTAAHCPPLEKDPGGHPELMLEVMYSAGNALLSLHAVTPHPDYNPAASFAQGSARWQGGRYAYSINWAPESISDAEARGIADALDPALSATCVLESRPITPSELAEFGLRPPPVPDGFRMEGEPVTRAFAIELGSECGPGVETGVSAEWLLLEPGRGGIVQIAVRRGPQDPHFPAPWYDESRVIYWKGAGGAEYWITGGKALYEKSQLVEFARSIDPEFEEGRLTTPPAP